MCIKGANRSRCQPYRIQARSAARRSKKHGGDRHRAKLLAAPAFVTDADAQTMTAAQRGQSLLGREVALLEALRPAIYL